MLVIVIQVQQWTGTILIGLDLHKQQQFQLTTQKVIINFPEYILLIGYILLEQQHTITGIQTQIQPILTEMVIQPKHCLRLEKLFLLKGLHLLLCTQMVKVLWVQILIQQLHLLFMKKIIATVIIHQQVIQ